MKHIGIQMKDKDKNNIYPNPFPIGAIYMSVDGRNPSTIFGGKWEQIKDRFLLSAGDVYKTGTTGGNSSHYHTTGNCTLNLNQIPSHSHSIYKTVPFGIPYNDTSGTACGAGGGTFYHESYNPFWIGENGGNQPHNHGNTNNTSNMPPYLVVYVWRRIL